jgi:outer membrane protein assembly factor BamB
MSDAASKVQAGLPASQVQADLPPTEPQAPLAAAPAPPVARPRPRPRLWPGVAIAVLMLLAIWVPGWLGADPFVRYMAVMWAPIAATVGIALWWLFFSRVRWLDRVLGLAAFIAAAAATAYLSPLGFAQPMGPMLLIIFALPVVLTVWVVWLVVAMFVSLPIARVGLVAALLLAWGAYICLRFDGLDGSMHGTLTWRWSQTAEDRFIADQASIGKAPAAAALKLAPGDWPGFRGPDRDGSRTGVRIATDWNQNPPHQLWRHRVGPGWSSFAVVGDAVYTQEQRGPNETVVCYDAGSGKEVWAHGDATRFEESLGGNGPRATPTFFEGKIYALGATGRLNCLDAATGEVVWTRNIADDSGAKIPMWGFASSPLVRAGLVTVFAGGPGDKSLLAYDVASDKPPVWTAGSGTMSFASPHPAKIGGVEQVLCSTEVGLTAIDPAKGDVLWTYKWPQEMHRILQPTVVDDSDFLIGGFTETRRVHVSHDNDAWTTEDVWSCPSLKPNFNDTVVYKGFAYGFDTEPALVCIDLEGGHRKWRTRAYGAGQVLLLADQGLLLVQSEKPCVAALVEAKPEAYKELARCQLFPEEEKTWNHPVVAHGRLFVRNAEEAACFQLTEAPAATEGK